MSVVGSSLSSGANRFLSASSARIRCRRSLSLLLMTLVVPGSAQLVAGNKAVGRVAVRVWLGVLGFALLLALLAVTHRSAILTLVTDPALLLGMQVSLILLALAWMALFCDAWRLGDPRALRRGQRLAMVGVNGALCIVTGGALLFSAHLVSVQRDFIAAVFSGGEVYDPTAGRYNVLLLGGDSGSQRSGMRPDSISVASIDEDTGKTVLFGLPRNMENVPFPDGSVMAEQFPDGFACRGCFLNGVYTWATDHAELFPGVKKPGEVATEQAVEAITGLPIHYYAMVNLKGFRDLVDAVGGITIDVPEEIPIGGIGGAVTGAVPAGVHKLDGYQTLWFARSRVADDDYSRMARQKCVMSAMLQQLKPRTVLTHVQEIADASKALLSTNLPASELDTFIGLALKARSQPVGTVSFVPPTIATYDPDYELIHTMVVDAIAKSEGEPTDGRQAARANRRAKAANRTDDLAAAC